MAKFPIALTFDDVLLKPGASDIEPGQAQTKTEAVKGLFLDIPVLSAAMDRVTEEKMAIALGRLGGLGVLHRNCEIARQAKMVRAVKKANVKVAAACGPFDMQRAKALENEGADLIVVDCAHGHNRKVVESARDIKKVLKKAKLIVGNVATEEAAKDLVPFVDGIKVGVGPGSICTTRLVSGVGVPQLSAVLNVVSVAKKHKVPVIADGGIMSSGDLVKALAAGASSVMVGNILAGTEEAPGRIIIKEGKKYKEYRGMGSKAVLKSRLSSDRYLIKGKGFVEEGVEALIAYKGGIENVIEQLIGGLKVGMGYIGAKNIPEIPKKAKFIFITKAAIHESRPHHLDFILDSEGELKRK